MQGLLRRGRERRLQIGFREFRYLVNVCESRKLVYVETPKVACTTIKRRLQIAETGIDPGRAAGLHDRKSSPLGQIGDMGDDFDRVFRSGRYFVFSFVRNPFTRALSAYIEKLVRSEFERGLRLPKLGLAADARPSFQDFLEILAGQTPAQMDVHWAPQAALLNHELVRYDFIGRFEALGAGLAALGAAFDLPDTTAAAGQDQVHRTDAAAQLGDHMTPACAELVRTVYKQDFDTYGYSRDPRFCGV